MGQALIWPWSLPSFCGAPRPHCGSQWAEPTPGLAGRLQAGRRPWHCAEAVAGQPAVDSESFPTLAGPGHTATWWTVATTAARPPSLPRQKHWLFPFTGEEPEVQRGSVCTLIHYPTLPLRWAGGAGGLGVLSVERVLPSVVVVATPALFGLLPHSRARP